MTTKWKGGEWNALIRGMEAQGCEVRVTKNSNGMLIRTPCGDSITLHYTESDARAIKNTKARIRRAGLEWPLDHSDKHRKKRECAA